MEKLILASGSIRRKELLDMLGIKYRSITPDIDESFDPDLEAVEQVQQLAEAKALKVAAEVNRHDTLILAADTIVVLGKKMYGKPETIKEAKEMLFELNAKTHFVYTAYSIINSETKVGKTNYGETRVTFRNNPRDQIIAYAESEEPLGKVGAYAVQLKGSLLIEKIEGDFHNIIGLPVADVVHDLREMGFNYEFS